MQSWRTIELFHPSPQFGCNSLAFGTANVPEHGAFWKRLPIFASYIPHDTVRDVLITQSFSVCFDYLALSPKINLVPPFPAETKVHSRRLPSYS